MQEEFARFAPGLAPRRMLSWVLCAIVLSGIAACGSTVREEREADSVAESGEREAERLRRAQAAREAEADYRLGLSYADGEGVAQDYAEALVWFERAGNLGHVGAQYLTGIAYYTGRGVAEDRGRGIHWFERAAAAGHARAQYQLGDAFLNGRGVAREPAWAALWLGEAARQGNVAAQFDLGVVNAAGLGVPIDNVQAVRWLTLAERGGREDARPVLDKVWERLTPRETERAETLGQRPSSALTGRAAEPTVRFVQAGLNQSGFDTGKVDGIAGKRTAAAVRAYRKARNLPAGGDIDDALVERLRRDLAPA